MGARWRRLRLRRHAERRATSSNAAAPTKLAPPTATIAGRDVGNPTAISKAPAFTRANCSPVRRDPGPGVAVRVAANVIMFPLIATDTAPASAR